MSKWCDLCGFLPCRCDQIKQDTPLTDAKRLIGKFLGYLELASVSNQTGRRWEEQLNNLLVNHSYNEVLRVMQYACVHSAFWVRLMVGYVPKGSLDVMGFFVKKFDTIEGQLKGDEKFRQLKEGEKRKIVEVPNAVEHEEI